MKHGNRVRFADEIPVNIQLSRREALVLVGGSALAMAMAGCGGGSGGSGSPGNVVPGDSGRTVITGDVTAQFNQFSAIGTASTAIWLGTSPALAALSSQQGKASRAPTDVKLSVQALTIGVNGTRAAYERLCNMALTLDDLGKAAATVNANNSLSGATALNNEQWLMAMIAQNYAAVSVTGTLFVMQQISGIPEARAWVLARTSDDDKLAAYGLVADVFNTWVDTLCAVANITPSAAWKLDLTTAVNATNIATNLNKIDTIMPLLPFSPGYRKPGVAQSQVDDDSLGASGIQNFAQTFTGVLARLTLSNTDLVDTFPQTVDTTKSTYSVAARLGTTGIGTSLKALSGGIAGAQTNLDNLLTSTDGSSWPGVTGVSAQNQLLIIGKTYGFLQALSTAIISTQTALGSLITGAKAIQFLNDLETTIAANASVPQKSLWNAVKSDRDLLKSQQLLSGAVPVTRQVNVIRVTGRTEFDQVSAAGVICTNTLTIGIPDVCPLVPTTPDVPNYRIIISGLKKLPDCPRTFRNVLICITGLIYDIALLYPDTVAAKWVGKSLMFCCATFARVLRREPQASFVEIPAITSAQLLCGGVGFIPSKSLTPINLGAIPNMPDLKDLTGLVGGVPINVH